MLCNTHTSCPRQRLLQEEMINSDIVFSRLQILTFLRRRFHDFQVERGRCFSSFALTTSVRMLTAITTTSFRASRDICCNLNTREKILSSIQQLLLGNHTRPDQENNNKCCTQRVRSQLLNVELRFSNFNFDFQTSTFST